MNLTKKGVNWIVTSEAQQNLTEIRGLHKNDIGVGQKRERERGAGGC